MNAALALGSGGAENVSDNCKSE